MSPRYNLSFCACKTAWLAPELLVSMCPSPYLWFLHAKQRILDQNFKSLWVPDLIFGFCMQNSAFRNRIASLYGSQTTSVVSSTHNSMLSTRLCWFQPSPVVLFMQNSVFWSRITTLYGIQTSPVVLCIQISVMSTRITFLYGSQPLSVVFACKTATFGAELQVSMGPRHDLLFCACKTAW